MATATWKDKANRLARSARELFWSSPLESFPEYQDAANFRSQKLHEQCDDCEWVFDYALQYYERLAKIWKELDDKANEIIKYLGGGTGLFAFGLMAKADQITPKLVAASLPAIGCALFSVLMAVLARKPNKTWLPPDAKAAFIYATHHTRHSRTEFIGQLHEQSELMWLAIGAKSRRVLVATWAFFGAIALLWLPILLLLKQHS